MARFYDVTVSIRDGMFVYKGDAGVSVKRIKTIADGGCNLSAMSIGVHTGTHVDAPHHFIDGGRAIDSFPAELMVTDANVVEIDADAIGERDLRDLRLPDWNAVLFKTRNRVLWERREFSTEFVALAEGGARFLVERGTRLVGIDYLGIEKFGSKDHAVHKALLGRGIFIVEGLYLNDVPAGRYRLYCFPLKIAGSDGAPARVVLSAGA